MAKIEDTCAGYLILVQGNEKQTFANGRQFRFEKNRETYRIFQKLAVWNSQEVFWVPFIYSTS